MISFRQRISLLNYLGELFRDISSDRPVRYVKEAEQLTRLLPAVEKANPWFTGNSVLFALRTWGESLYQDKIEKWILPYNLEKNSYECRDIFVIMAGNIPLVGMHDFLCVLLSGHRFTGKLSSRDNLLLPLIKEWITNFDKDWEELITFTAHAGGKAEVVIATGSNNTSRIIRETYSGAKRIIRHNRNSIALLSGKETDAELEKLADDILLYYGLGCRNVSGIFIPANYSLDKLVDIIKNYQIQLPESILNNLIYQRAIASMHSRDLIDAGKVLLIRDEGLNSPIGTVYFSEYRDVNEIKFFRTANMTNIQCVVGNPTVWDGVIGFGKAQKPELYEYADGIDTIEFLMNL